MSVQAGLASSTKASFSLAVKNLSPAWFGSVMGTGIFAVASKYYACYWSWLNNLAAFLWILNCIFFLILIIPWVMRWLLFREQALQDLDHPIVGQFYSTMPIGALVLAVDFLVIGTDYLGLVTAIDIAKILWIGGSALGLVTAFVIPISAFLKKVAIDDLNPAWFMPPVALIVIPVAGAKLITYWPHAIQKVLLLSNYMAWGMGFFLFLFLAIICFFRLIVAQPLAGSFLPTIWIFLGPIGVGTVALFNLATVSTPFLGDIVMPIIKMFALVYWGFGFWWLIAASSATIIYTIKRTLPFALSWWAFTFPLGAYASATFLISLYFQSDIIKLFGLLCYCLLAFFWIMVISQTLFRIDTFFKE